MIVDTVERMHLYASVLPYAREIRACFLREDAAGMPCETRIKAYETRPDDARRFEVHDHTVDLMIGITGEEIIHLCGADELTPAEPLQGGGDGRKMDGAPRGHTVRLRPGLFIAIYPGEAHMVAGQTEKGVPGSVNKWVVKIPLGE